MGTFNSIDMRRRLLLVAICAGLGVAACAPQAFGSFGKPRGFAVGQGPSAIVIGKFNGDGKRDIAVANSTSSNVSILLGKGAGAFSKARNFAVGKKPTSLAIGEFNGDGKRDIAVANAGAGSVSILLAKGNGSFAPAASFPALGGASYLAYRSRTIAVGDFNNDTNRDIAVVNNTGVSILLGNGNGSFGPPTSYPAGINPSSVVVGNLNGDANLDLAVANGGAVDCGSRLGRGAQTSSCTGGFGTVSVLLGHGDGSFGAATNFDVGGGTDPSAAVLGNFNSDTKPDLALADFMQYSDSVSVLLGKGSGSFGKPGFFPVFPSSGGASPYSLAVGDVNQDRRDDLAAVSFDSKNVSVVLGRGGGSFGAPSGYPTGAGRSGEPTAVAIGNLNAGSNPDLAVTIDVDRVAILLNGGPSPRTATLSYSRKGHRFTGRLRSADPTCMRSQRVRVLRRRAGRDSEVGAAVTGKSGTYSISKHARPGTYYARVRAWSACRAENSETVAIERR
ncbi:MAG: VCBS repeat-containing protein [Solirubrobacterales bacterium]